MKQDTSHFLDYLNRQRQIIDEADAKFADVMSRYIEKSVTLSESERAFIDKYLTGNPDYQKLINTLRDPNLPNVPMPSTINSYAVPSVPKNENNAIPWYRNVRGSLPYTILIALPIASILIAILILSKENEKIPKINNVSNVNITNNTNVDIISNNTNIIKIYAEGNPRKEKDSVKVHTEIYKVKTDSGKSAVVELDILSESHMWKRGSETIMGTSLTPGELAFSLASGKSDMNDPIVVIGLSSHEKTQLGGIDFEQERSRKRASSLAVGFQKHFKKSRVYKLNLGVHEDTDRDINASSVERPAVISIIRMESSGMTMQERKELIIKVLDEKSRRNEIDFSPSKYSLYASNKTIFSLA